MTARPAVRTAPALRAGSLAVLREAQAPSGAIVASTAFGQYDYSWFRDGAFIAHALCVTGEQDRAARFHHWTAGVVLRERPAIEAAIADRQAGQPVAASHVLEARYRVDGSRGDEPWPNFQLDGVGAWLWALREWALRERALRERAGPERTAAGGDAGQPSEALSRLPGDLAAAARLASEYLAALWDQPSYDCWEEAAGEVHVSTLAAVYGGLMAAADLLGEDQWRATAGRVRELALGPGVRGGRLRKHLDTDLVDGSLAWAAVPFGLLDPADPLMTATAEAIAADLTGPTGGIYRYLGDTYYGGGEWLPLAGHLGWYWARAPARPGPAAAGLGRGGGDTGRAAARADPGRGAGPALRRYLDPPLGPGSHAADLVACDLPDPRSRTGRRPARRAGRRRAGAVMTVRFVSLTPERACFAPGEPWRLRLRLRSAAPADAVVRIGPVQPDPAGWAGDLAAGGPGQPGPDRAGQAAGPAAEYRVRLKRGLTQLDCMLAEPPAAERGYLVAAVIETAGGVITGHGAADVLADWRDDPRYGFLSEFGPGDTGQAGRAAAMAGLHLNCAQFYDWAYRHDQLLPPAADYQDPIGRRLSLDSVRASIAACRDHGIAPLGYAALYAGLPDFAAAHPDWQITDGAGRPEHLAELFYLMNPAGEGWRAHLLSQLDQALGALDFDGFHLDQYGYPRTAWDRSGAPVDVGAGLASLARAAAARVAARRPGGGVIANAVGAWPLPDFAAVPQAATYVEVWEPYTRYEDLVSLADRARLLAARPVLLAAYPSFLRAEPHPGPGPASGGLGLLTAVILAAGAWPLLAGEGERVLADPYYPRHVLPPARARTELQRLLDFGVAFRSWLRGPKLRAAEPAFIAGPAAEWQFSAPHSARPEPGRIWARASTSPGWTVLSLVNLAGVRDPAWDRPQPPARPGPVTITLPRHLKEPACWAASPERGLEQLPVTGSADGSQVTVPLRLWTLLAIRDRSAR